MNIIPKTEGRNAIIGPVNIRVENLQGDAINEPGAREMKNIYSLAILGSIFIAMLFAK